MNTVRSLGSRLGALEEKLEATAALAQKAQEAALASAAAAASSYAANQHYPPPGLGGASPGGASPGGVWSTAGRRERAARVPGCGSSRKAGPPPGGAETFPNPQVPSEQSWVLHKNAAACVRR